MKHWSTIKRLWLLTMCLLATILLLNLPERAAAQNDAPQATPSTEEENALFGVTSSALDLNGFGLTLADIAPRMLLAALLGGLVAYRRRLTVFEHDLFHAHILLSVAGALMMLIVQDQMVRAFGLLGAASVVRYRYGLRNPRDASMLIIALGIGMATGIGLHPLAVSAAVTVFVFARGLNVLTARPNLLMVITRPTTLKLHTTRPEETLAQAAQAFAQHNVSFRLQRYSREQQEVNGAPVYVLAYTVWLSPDDSRSALTSEIVDQAVVSMQWKTEKPRKG
jgi:uncharacterized membrane protein YhiD involved in acid resistance